MTANKHLRTISTLGVSLPVISILATALSGLLCPLAAYSDPVILETDYTNSQYLVGGSDATLDPAWASNLCDGRTFLDNRTPLFEWTPVFGGEYDANLVGVSGTIIEEPSYSDADVWFTHPFGFDWEFHIAPDQSYGDLLAPSSGCTEFASTGEPCVNPYVDKVDDEVHDAVINAHNEGFALPTSPLGVQGILGVETDQGLVPPDYRGRAHKGDRVALFGRWIADCGHADFHSEMHPPLLMAFGRQVTGAAGQPVTYSEVISRPYLVSQTFEDGLGARHHLYNELLKAMAVPDCFPIDDVVQEFLDESGGCKVTECAEVCVPVVGCGDVCVDTFCLAPPLWFTTPCSTRFEAHQKFMEKPFAGNQTMSYIVRPPVARQCAGHKLLVSTHFTVRHGVTASIDPVGTDAARVTITMDNSRYTAPPLPPKADLSLSIDDIRRFNDGTADQIETIDVVLLSLASFGIDPQVGILFDHTLGEGLLTDCYDPSYGTIGPSSFPGCAALSPLTAVSSMDSVNVVVATPIDQVTGAAIYAEDNSDGQVFPIYGSASVEWSQEKFPPVVTINQPTATQYLHTAVLTLNYSETDTGCGVGGVTAIMDGMTTINNHGLASGQVIDLLTEMTPGDHTFTVDASDNIGDASTASVTFSIIVTAQSIEDDVTRFLASGAIAQNEGRPLLAKLDAAASARVRGQCKTANNNYQAFINEVNAQSGKKISAQAAAIMIADAQYLIAHCP